MGLNSVYLLCFTPTTTTLLQSLTHAILFLGYAFLLKNKDENTQFMKISGDVSSMSNYDWRISYNDTFEAIENLTKSKE